MIVAFLFPELPPSTNNLFMTRGRHRARTPAYIKFNLMVRRVAAAHPDRLNLAKWGETPFILRIECQAPTWRFKNGKARKWDVSNRIKAIEDCICDVFGWKDEYCVKVIASKTIAPKEGTFVRFCFLPKSFLP